MIRTEFIPTVTAVGTAGTSATGTQQSIQPVNGKLKTIGVAQANVPHANTDITISISDGVNSRVLLTLTNYNTTTLTFLNVRAPAVSQANAALVFAGTDPVPVEIPLDGYITVLVAQGGSAATCDVVIVYEE